VRYAHDYPIKKARGAFCQVYMAIGNGVKGARVNDALGSHIEGQFLRA
jgi:hypothetical protein